MGLLEGKTALIFGLANKNSIAWGITQAFHREGATIGMSYAIDSLERRVKPLAESIGADFVEKCNVENDEEIDGLFEKVKERFGKIDIMVHAIAFANRDDLSGRYLDTTREGFHTALGVSCYSLIALAQRAESIMPDGGSIMTLTYFGGEKVMPNYNVMGVAKSALDSSVRYLAADMGPKGVRVNAISAGPIKTLAAAGITGFRLMTNFAEKAAPLRQLVSQDDVGNAAVWLASDWSSMVTGEVLHVDAGYNILGLPVTDDDPVP